MKQNIPDSQRIGITEAGEPAFNQDIFENLYDANIIITKTLSNGMIDNLIRNKNKIILHLTCTGYGGTVLEPNVPDMHWTRTQLDRLLDRGFPATQVVLRIDPCIPTVKGRKLAYEVAALFAGKGITRLRFSLMDMYKHVQERFKAANVPAPYYTFHASDGSRKDFLEGMQAISKRYGYEIETCGEPGMDSIPCISKKDIQILGLEDRISLTGNAMQRKHCGCPANKTELIRKGRPHRCDNRCLYCFWRDEESSKK